MMRLLIFSFLLLSLSANGQNDFLTKLKKEIPNATFDTISLGKHFKKEWVVMLDQPIDHNNPDAGTFQQRIFLSHYDKDAPVVFVTEGYNARHRHYELCDILMSNQIQVEYRFFGKSKPTPYDYTYLTNDQAMEDLHRIRKLFGKVYKKEWISTGISKGGTTCLIYKTKYPKDVKVAIPYVAPLPKAREDKRCDEHILTRGDQDCQDRLARFQQRALSLRDSIIPMVDSLAIVDSLTFNRVGTDGAFEYAVLEFTFSLWQWGHDCNRVVDDMNARDCFELIKEIVGFDFYSDATIAYFEPAFYQFMRENGYYGFINKHVQPLIKSIKSFDNSIFAPLGSDTRFDEDYLKYVRVWLYHKGDKIIYIQGDLDPWGACGMVPPKERDALLMTKENGSHFTRIKSFDQEDQNKIYSALDRWLKAKVHPLEKEVKGKP